MTEVRRKREGFEQVKGSINRKAQQEEEVHAIDSTRGVPKRLVEQRCSEKEIHAKSSSEISAKSEHCSGTGSIVRTVHY